MKLLLTVMMLCVGAWANSQTMVTGKVTDEKGVALAGAVVSTQGKSSLSNEAGAFTIGVQLPVQLQVQLAGYVSRTITADSSNYKTIIIVLQSAVKELDEVVVSTGLQQVPKERATGSFAHVNNAQLSRQVSTSIINALEGTVNALNFDKRSNRGQTVNLMIRGRSTLFGDAAPLIVLDGFAYEGDISTINPNDVESVSFLKDAAAASIWGVRAANGVIVITTKKGKQEQPMRVQLQSNITIGMRPDFTRLNTISSADFIEMEQFLFGKGFYTSQENAAAKTYLSPVVEILIKKRDGLMTAAAADAAIAQLKTYDVKKDYNEYLYRRMVNRQHNISISGGGKQVAYYLSAGLDDNTDNSYGSYRRVSVKADNSYYPVEALQLRVSIVYTQTNAGSGMLRYNEVHPGGGKLLYPYARLADDNGVPVATGRDYRTGYLQGLTGKGLLNWEYYPLEEGAQTSTNSITRDVLVNTSVQYKFRNGLNAELRYQYQGNSSGTSNLNTQESYFTRDLINRYSQANSTGVVIRRPIPLGSILNTRTADMESYAIRGQLNYQRRFNQHEVTALAGAEERERKFEGASNRIYGYNENILTNIAVNYDSIYRMYHNNGSTGRIPYGNSVSATVNRYRSIYFNGAYCYMNKYTISFSARKDGSNLFGVNTNQKFVPLWSAGAAWQVSKEDFYKLNWLPVLKLRTSYGYSGNVDNSLTAYTTVAYTTGGLNNIPYAVFQTPPNPSLQWEETGMLNIGVDFATSGKRVSGSIEYYRKHSDHLIGDAPVDPTTGVANALNQAVYRGNVAAMKGSGVDLELRSVNTDRMMRWITTLQLSYNKNEITKYLLPVTSGSTYLNSGTAVYPAIGFPVFAIWSYRSPGLDNTGNPVGYLDGKESKDYVNIISKTTLDQLKYHGPGTPVLFGNVMNEFSFKKLTVSFNVMYRFGHYFRRGGLNYNFLYNNWNGHSDFAERWQQPGDELRTHVPVMAYPVNTSRESFYTNSEVLVEKADNIRLKDMRVNYDLDLSKRRIGVKQIQLFLYANNVAMLWKATKTNIDPDILYEIPQPLTVSFGLKANF